MSVFLSLGQQPPLAIIFEDKDIIAVCKPAGQLFHGYTKGLPSPLVDQVKDSLRERYHKPGQVYLGVVHRLDRPVSGLAVFGRNSKVTARLSEQFQERSLEKIYLAVVEGIPQLSEATLEDELLALASSESPDKEKRQACSLSYRLLHSMNGLSLLAIKLGTGRRHQIRRQLSQRQLPIVGDLEYGARSLIPGTENLDQRFRPLALHAARLQFRHPISQAPLHIDAAIPSYFMSLGFSPEDYEGFD